MIASHVQPLVTKMENPEPNLEQIVDGFITAVRLIEQLRGVSAGDLVFHGPSRNLVATDPRGTFIAKSSVDPTRYRDELDNLVRFHAINDERRKTFQDITGSDQEYMGLPSVDPALLDARRVSVGATGVGGLYLFDTVQGDLLYDKMLKGTATFNDFVLSAVQIARISQEGKLHSRALMLKNPGEDYSTNRFVSNFLRQLAVYGGVSIPESVREEMTGNWGVLVRPVLVDSYKNGHTGMYFDGQPKHHIYPPQPSNVQVVSLDFEEKSITPTLLGQASLLSAGVNKPDGTPYVSKDEQQKILDRILLELELVVALHNGYVEKAKRIFDHIKGRYDQGVHNLISDNPQDDMYLILGGSGDRNQAMRYREDFLSRWPYALLQRDSEWIGHKARYRAVAERLLEKGIKFQVENPVLQNAKEQQVHLDSLLTMLDQLIQTMPAHNGRMQPRTAAIGLYNRLTDIRGIGYFN